MLANIIGEKVNNPHRSKVCHLFLLPHASGTKVQRGVFLCIFLDSGSVSCSKVPAHVEPSRLSVVLRKGFLSAGVIHVFRFLKTPQPKTQRYDLHDKRFMSIRPNKSKSDLH